MALINCPECGKEISDTSKKCLHCGYKIKKEFKKPKIFCNKIFIVIFSVLLIAGLSVGGFFTYKNVIVPLNEYKTAEKLLENKKYDEAISQFEKLGDYKDCATKILQVHYEHGKDYLEDRLYSKAIDEFEQSTGYEDTETQIKETKYIWASKEPYWKAIELYEELGDYKDSERKLKNTKEARRISEAKKRLKDVYKLIDSDCATLSSDEMSITVDSKGGMDYEGEATIMCIIEFLYLPDSLCDEMSQTTALMGKQDKIYDDFEVSWSYHPDNGLDAIFSIVE